MIRDLPLRLLSTLFLLTVLTTTGAFAASGAESLKPVDFNAPKSGSGKGFDLTFYHSCKSFDAKILSVG
jgi:hypothetical protein